MVVDTEAGGCGPRSEVDDKCECDKAGRGTEEDVVLPGDVKAADAVAARKG